MGPCAPQKAGDRSGTITAETPTHLLPTAVLKEPCQDEVRFLVRVDAPDIPLRKKRRKTLGQSSGRRQRQARGREKPQAGKLPQGLQFPFPQVPVDLAARLPQPSTKLGQGQHIRYGGKRLTLGVQSLRLLRGAILERDPPQIIHVLYYDIIFEMFHFPLCQLSTPQPFGVPHRLETRPVASTRLFSVSNSM